MLVHQTFNSQTGNRYNARLYTTESVHYHFHRNLEIILVLDGQVDCRVGDRTERLCEGELGMILPNELHAFYPIDPARYWVGVFSEDLVPEFAAFVKGKRGDTLRFHCAEEVGRYVEARLVKTEAPTPYTLRSCLYALCDEYLRCVPLFDKAEVDNSFMAATVEFLSAHYREDVTLSMLAEHLNYDYHYVSRLFHAVFHLSFKRFLNLYRLEAALSLLREDRTISEVAEASGFQSVRTFNHCFLEQFGVSPSVYLRESGMG